LWYYHTIHSVPLTPILISLFISIKTHTRHSTFSRYISIFSVIFPASWVSKYLTDQVFFLSFFLTTLILSVSISDHSYSSSCSWLDFILLAYLKIDYSLTGSQFGLSSDLGPPSGSRLSRPRSAFALILPWIARSSFPVFCSSPTQTMLRLPSHPRRPEGIQTIDQPQTSPADPH
jgi:hypothetical protein